MLVTELVKSCVKQMGLSHQQNVHRQSMSVSSDGVPLHTVSPETKKHVLQTLSSFWLWQQIWW